MQFVLVFYHNLQTHEIDQMRFKAKVQMALMVKALRPKNKVSNKDFQKMIES